MESSQSSRWKIVLQLLVIAALCAVLAGVLLIFGYLKPSPASRRVNFHVDASGGYAIITLKAGSVSISQPTTVTTPWDRAVEIDTGTDVYLTASNPTQTGQLTCTITLDWRAWKKETTTAPKDGVACAGIVP